MATTRALGRTGWPPTAYDESLPQLAEALIGGSPDPGRDGS
ncbi:hypothetical protein ACFQ1I_46110 [Kitasatospora arboriphila]